VVWPVPTAAGPLAPAADLGVDLLSVPVIFGHAIDLVLSQKLSYGLDVSPGYGEVDQVYVLVPRLFCWTPPG